MSRGQAAEVGAERTAPNGYCYVKTAERSWVLKHWLVWEAANGRRVRPDEQVRFVDGNKKNFTPTNITVIPKGKVGIRKKLARVIAQIEELQAMKTYYERELTK